MNEEDGNNRRMLLAAALCLAVLVVWQLVFPPPAPVEPPEAEQTATATAPEEVDGAAVAETSTTGAAAVARTARVDPQTFEFSGLVPVDDEVLPYEVRLTNIGAAFESFELPTYKERDADNRATDDPIRLADPVQELPVREFRFGQMGGIDFGDATTFGFPRRPVYEVVEETEDSIKYRLVTRSGVVVERWFEFDEESFVVEMAVTIENRSSKTQTHELRVGAGLQATEAMKRGGGFFSAFLPPPDHLEALCHVDGSVERENINSLEEGEAERFTEQVRWIGVDRQYFLSAIVPRDPGRTEGSCKFEKMGERVRSSIALPPVELRPGERHRHKFTAFLGVKMPDLLESVDSELDGAINYTVLGLNLAPLCAALLWVLGFIHDLTGSWGLAIIGLTVLVKAILFPLNQRQGKSMRAMSALKPEMDKIREKYPDDRQRQSEEMMRLYKEHNVNPAGGCLPVLLQMPIWFALYRALWVSVDLYQEGFLWIGDLTTRDPYWILPITLMVVMFLQQKMMPAAMDPAQQKIMMYTMPLFFGFLMSALPAGLCFYILVNTLLTILQQQIINKSMGPPSGARKPAAQGARA